ncbi:MAG: thioredoxin-disulfide reductase [Culicoidibacterales bacterium]
METTYDLIIVGSGPAGMTAAIYASRANIKTVILEAGAPGGKMLKTMEIENWPGVTHGISPQIAYDMHKHSTAFGAEFKMGEVAKVSIDVESGMKKVLLTSGETLTAPAVIIATGTKERPLPLPNAEKLTGRGISYCAICDGAFFRNKHVMVIGGGNSAVDEAIHLAKTSAKVTIVHRRDEFRADQISLNRAEAIENIEIMRSFVAEEILEENNKVAGVVLRNVKTDELVTLEDVEGVFVYVGVDPITEMVVELGVTNEWGYVLVDENMETKIPGLYAAGDVIEKKIRQVVTAVNDGAIAAERVKHQLT